MCARGPLNCASIKQLVGKEAASSRQWDAALRACIVFVRSYARLRIRGAGSSKCALAAVVFYFSSLFPSSVVTHVRTYIRSFVIRLRACVVPLFAPDTSFSDTTLASAKRVSSAFISALLHHRRSHSRVLHRFSSFSLFAFLVFPFSNQKVRGERGFASTCGVCISHHSFDCMCR